MVVVDYILILFRFKCCDFKMVFYMEDILFICKMVNLKMNVVFVIIQCFFLFSLVNCILEVKEVCCLFGIFVLNFVIFSRNMYDDLEELGQLVIESELEGKVVIEIRILFEELLVGKVEDVYEFI